MGVAMDHRRVPVPMAVRPIRQNTVRMVVLVMRVMDMAMLMLERFMGMIVGVGLRVVSSRSI